MKRVGRVLVWPAVAGALMCAANEGAQTTVRLTVPQQVATEAAARAAGDAASPPPILMLEGLEAGQGEGLTIQVLGPPEPGSSQPSVLAVTGLVGPRQKEPAEPLQRMTLPVPLNEKASQLLAGKREVTLTLQVEDSPGRPPLKFERAYFDTGESSEPAPRGR